ncbi:MAG TPA: TetR family transcriptional regulator [Acidimicrobiales bacterium]|nr:TetR family transcriptional regulator [Acidimicrobiales bacterium]
MGLTADERREERRRLLLRAAYELLGTEGWSATTVRGVCQRARLNPRYFYESFTDLDALLIAVYDHVVIEMGEAVRQAVEAAGGPADGTVAGELEPQVRAVLGAVLRFIEADRRRGQILYVEALGNEALNRRRLDTGHALVDLVEQDAVAWHGPAAEGEPVAKISAAVLVGGFTELAVAWLDGRIDVSIDQIVDDATALFMAVNDAALRLAAGRIKQGATAGRGPGGRASRR